MWCCISIVAFSEFLAAAEPYDFEAAMEQMREAEGSEYFRQKAAFLKQPGADEFLVSLSKSGRVDTDWLARMLYDSKFLRRHVLGDEESFREAMTAVGGLVFVPPRDRLSYRYLCKWHLDHTEGRAFEELFDADGRYLIPPWPSVDPRVNLDTFPNALFSDCSTGFRAEAILNGGELPDLVKWECAISWGFWGRSYEEGIREHLWRSKHVWARHAAVYCESALGGSNIVSVLLGMDAEEPTVRVAARASLAKAKASYRADEGLGLAGWWRTHSPEDRAALLRSIAKHWPEARASLDAALQREREAPK